MPPTNISALTAITVESDVDVLVDLTGLAAPFRTWYRYLVREGEKLISAWSRPETIVGSNNTVRFDIYLGPASAPIPYDDIGQTSDRNLPKMIPLTSGGWNYMIPLPTGTEMFFECYWTTATPPNRNIKFTVYGEVSNTIPVDSIIVSSDGQPFPLVGMGWDGSIYGFTHHVNGEGGLYLPNGISAHTDKVGGDLVIYDAAHNQIAEVDPLPAVGSNGSNVSSDGSSTFYVNSTGNAPYTTNPGVVHVVSSAGVLLKSITFPGYGVWRLAVNRDNTVLYITTGNNNIRRWDLVNNVFLSDLYVLPASHQIDFDILVMSDNSLIFARLKTNAPARQDIVHMAPDGTELNSWTLPTLNAPGSFRYNRMCNGIGGDKVVIWLKDSLFLSRFVEYRQDGTLLRTTARDFEQFDVDGDADTAAYDTMEHWGLLNSCPVMVNTVPIVTDGYSVPILDLSGIYYINPTKAQKRDTYYAEDRKIPNPTVRTGLIGE